MPVKRNLFQLNRKTGAAAAVPAYTLASIQSQLDTIFKKGFNQL
jgi:hypothetical protein